MNTRFLQAALGSLAMVALFSCGDSQPESRGTVGVASEVKTTPREAIYTIVDTDIVPGVKRSLAIRLNQKVSEEVLRSIALELKNADQNEYERIFITYTLPGMEVGAGAWATTHFNPDLKVNILGLTAEEETTLANEPENPSREVVGRWLAQSLLTARFIIYLENGKPYMEQKLKDGSMLNKELVKKTSSRGQRFEEKEGSRFGEYYLIDRRGNLEVGDQDGLIATATKIN